MMHFSLLKYLALNRKTDELQIYKVCIFFFFFEKSGYKIIMKNNLPIEAEGLG